MQKTNGNAVVVQPLKIERGKIDACPETVAAECFDEFPCDIASVAGVHHIEARRFGIEHAEAGMMFRRKAEVVHSDRIGKLRIILRIKPARVEMRWEKLMILTQNPFRGPDQRMADFGSQQRIAAPVNEHSQSQIAEHLHTVGGIAPGKGLFQDCHIHIVPVHDFSSTFI